MIPVSDDIVKRLLALDDAIAKVKDTQYPPLVEAEYKHWIWRFEGIIIDLRKSRALRNSSGNTGL